MPIRATIAPAKTPEASSPSEPILGAARRPQTDPLVNYRYAVDPARSCKTCRHFKAPGACGLVLGMVRPVDVCDMWDGEEGQTRRTQAYFSDDGESKETRESVVPVVESRLIVPSTIIEASDLVRTSDGRLATGHKQATGGGFKRVKNLAKRRRPPGRVVESAFVNRAWLREEQQHGKDGKFVSGGGGSNEAPGGHKTSPKMDDRFQKPSMSDADAATVADAADVRFDGFMQRPKGEPIAVFTPRSGSGGSTLAVPESQFTVDGIKAHLAARTSGKEVAA